MLPITNVRTIQGTVPLIDEENKARINVYHKDNLIGHCKTDREGNFKFQTAALGSNEKRVDLVFALVNENRIHEAKDFRILKERTEIAAVHLQDIPVDAHMDVGRVNFDNYFTEERAPLGYYFDIIKSVLPNKLKGGWEGIKEAVDIFDTHNIKDVKETFKIGSTPLTLESTLNVLRNGICPLTPKFEEDLEIYELNLDRYSFDKEYCLPNFRLEVNKNTDEFQRLTLEWTKKTGAKVVDKQIMIYMKGSPNLADGLLGMNSTVHIFGQTVFHLALRHIWGAFIAQKVIDILPGTKLGELLLPHCGLTKTISDLGNKRVVPVLDISGFDAAGVSQLIIDAVGWKDPFIQKKDIPSEKHIFAKASLFHNKNLRGVINELTKTEWEQIKQEWPIYSRFFRELHEDSMPYFPLFGEEKEDPSLPPRTEFKGKLRSFRHICKNPDKPEHYDKTMIERFVADFISSQTVEHDWIHKSQFEERPEQHVTPTADPEAFPLGIARFAEGNSCGGMTFADATRQIQLAATFRDFNIDNYTIKNTPTVYKGITSRIDKNSKEYAKLGVDSNKIPTSVVI